ncbi:MAG TPA: hypothetical protein VEU33_51715, partial [Archangium sp.]|nr:hypothetical protein [Archangium sp.]
MLKGTYSALMLGLALVGVGGAANAEPPAGAAGVAAEAQDLMNDNLDADPRWERISEGLWRKSGDGEKAYVAKGPQGRSAYRAIVALEIQGLEQRLKQKHDDSAAKELKGKYEDWRMLGEDGGVSSALSPICP